MSISDFFIIYLACGAPCGVYFFLQNRKKFDSRTLLVKSFLTVVVWIPYALRLLNDFATKRKQAKHFNDKLIFEKQLSEIQKQLFQIQINSPADLSHFEFREVLERYAGLTLACRSDEETTYLAESEIFRIALRENSDVATECLRRRNRQRLLFHQTMARKDFLQSILRLKTSGERLEILKKKTLEFVLVLNDKEARKQLEEIFAETLQSGGHSIVPEMEEEVWKPKKLNSPSPSKVTIRLKASIAVTSRKD